MNPNFFFDGFEIINLDKSYDRIDSFLDEFRKILILQLEFINIDNNVNDTTYDLLLKLFNKDIDRYLSTLRLSSKLISVTELVNCDEIKLFSKKNGVNIPVMQTKPVLHLIGDNLNIPGGYNGVGVHQDWSTLQSSLNTMVVWIPLLDVNENNYTLDVLPKSHLNGLMSGSLNSNYTEIDSSLYNNNDFVSLDIKKGQIVLMSSFLVHRSNMNGKGYRISISSRIEDAAEPTFVDRNFPFTEHKVVKRNKIFDDFPTKSDVLKIYTDL